MNARLIVFLALAAVSGSSSALVIGGSNLSLMGYPDHDCRKPIRPYDLSNEWAVDSYNRDAREYRDCMIEYLENAEKDVERIKEKMQEAVDDAARRY